MGAAYYRGFNVAEVDTDGFVQPVVSITLDVHDVATASFIDTVSVDASGIVAEGSFSASVGDVVEFSNGSYPLKFRQTLTNTQDEAYLHPDNNVVTYILENSYASTNPVTDADLYAQDLDDLGQRPIYLGTVKAGVTTNIPYQSSVPKNLRLMLVSKDSYGSQDVADFAYAQFEDVSVPALAPGTVTNVALTVPTFLSVLGSPITGSGTLAVTLANQSANTIFAGPTSGGAAAPTFRALVAADIPSLDTSKLTSGTLGVARGGTGTGTAFTAGSLVFAGASGVYSQDNSNLFWDDSNNRLGIGTASPQADLHVARSTNGGIGISIINSTSGTVAREYIEIGQNIANSQQFRIGYWNSGNVVWGSDTAVMETGVNSVGGIVMATTTTAPITFYTNTTVRGQFTSGGNFLVGTTYDGVGAKLVSLRSSGLQLALLHDGSNYMTGSVASNGTFTIDVVGSVPKTVFNDAVEIPINAYGIGWSGSAKAVAENALYDHFSNMGWAKNNQTLGSPSTSDDNTQGYSAGSQWTDISGGKAYHCFDASTGAADWQLIN